MTTEVVYKLPHFMFVLDINSHNFNYLRHVNFIQLIVRFFTMSNIFRNVPFDPLYRLLWTQNRVNHQYRQSITIKSIDSVASKFHGIG